MSFSFYIRTPNVDFVALDVALRGRFGDVLGWEAAPPDPWPIDFTAHAYLWGISTRSVELTALDGSFQVRILSCSCPEDYELALAAVEWIAQTSHADIESEWGDTFGVNELRAQYDDEWVAAQAHAGATVIPRMLQSGTVKGPLTLPGPHRDFIIGDRVLAELAGPEDTFPQRLFDKIRTVRYFGADQGYFAANIMQLTRDSGEPVTIAIWGPGVAYLFPNVQYLTITTRPPLFVPLDVVPDLLLHRCRRLDERQLLVEAIYDPEWDELIEAAALFAVDLDVDLQGRR